MKKALAFLLSLVMILGIFSGCSSSGGTSSAAPSAAAQKKENVVTVGVKADMSTWNPFMGIDASALIYGKLIYDTLISGDRKGTYTPALATEWKSTPDGKTWTFKLRNDVKFHNGDPLTSADVKFTIEKLAFDKTVRTNNDWSAIASVDTPDAQTVVFNLKSVWTTMQLALMDTFIVSKKDVEAKGEKAWEKPLGSGPWKFESWQAGQQCSFVKNDAWWNWGNNKSNVDKFVFKPIGEDSTRLAAIQTGSVDVVLPISDDQAKQLSNVKDIKLERTLSTSQVNLNFNCTGIFADKNVRKAFSLAIDRDLIVKTIVGSGKPAVWFVTPDVIGYKDMPVKADVEQAKKLLAASGYKGEPFKILFVGGSAPRINETIQAISSMVNAVGFNSSVEMVEQAAYNSRRTAGQYTVNFNTAMAVGGDASPFISTRWLLDMYKSGYKNDAMNDLIKKANSELDPKKRIEMLTQIFQMSYDDTAPSAPVYTLENISAYKDNISGIFFSPDGMHDFTRTLKK